MNTSQWKHKKPFQEVWYTTFNDDQKRGFWFRYTLLNPKDEKRGPQATVWAFVFDPKKRRKISYQQSFQKNFFSFEDYPFSIRVGNENTFSDGKLKGNIENKIKWDLTFQKNKSTVHLIPNWITKLPIAKTHYIIPYQDTSFSGVVYVDNQMLSIQNAQGTQAHIWGIKHAYTWIWGHCNAFEQKGYSFEILGAKIYPSLPYITFGYLKTPSYERYFQNPLLNKIRIIDRKCHFSLKNSSIELKGTLWTEPENQIDVVYTRVTDQKFHCHNSEVSHSQLLFIDHHASRSELISKGTTHFEFINP